MKTLPLLTMLVLACTSLKAFNPDYTIVPFRLHRNIIIVQGQADKVAGYFILDTGVASLTLNSKYFYGTETNITFYDVHGNASKVTTIVTNLHLGDWTFKNELAHVVDFHALEKALPFPVIGCIGVAPFQDCELVLDYVFQELTIYKLDNAGNRKSDYFLHTHALETLYFKKDDGMPIIPIKIGEQSLQLGLDSGAGINLLNEKLKSSLTPYIIQSGNGNVTGINSKMENLEMAKIEAIQVGKLNCLPMRMMFTSIEKLNKVSPRVKIDGILGYEFLSQFRVAINFSKKEILVWDKATMEMQLAMRKKMDANR